jgi:hypothetical protein
MPLSEMKVKSSSLFRIFAVTDAESALQVANTARSQCQVTLHRRYDDRGSILDGRQNMAQARHPLSSGQDNSR